MLKRIVGFSGILVGAFLSLISFYSVREFLFGGPAVEISMETNWVLFSVGLVLVVFGIWVFRKK